MIKGFDLSFYDEVIELWKSDKGIGLSIADSRERIARFLECNSGLCFVAVEDSTVIGTVLCGTDTRRGYIYHLFVDPEYRRKGVASSLMERVFQALEKMGVEKCHLFVFRDNEGGKLFWEKSGWKERCDLSVYSKDIIQI